MLGLVVRPLPKAIENGLSLSGIGLSGFLLLYACAALYWLTFLPTCCPGIRYDVDDKQDQIRVSTPEEAIENGADYLVMGRSFFNQ